MSEPDQLLCSQCTDIQIEIGFVPASEIELKTMGRTIRITEDASVVKIPTVLMPVVEKFSDESCRLACGHLRFAMPLVSSQERYTMSDGIVVRGHLPL